MEGLKQLMKIDREKLVQEDVPGKFEKKVDEEKKSNLQENKFTSVKVESKYDDRMKTEEGNSAKEIERETNHFEERKNPSLTEIKPQLDVQDRRNLIVKSPLTKVIEAYGPVTTKPKPKNPFLIREEQVNLSIMSPFRGIPDQVKEKSETVILVCGAVMGKFKLLFSKVEKYLKKTPCEYLFCTGEFFGPNTDELNALLSGKIKVPIATYILGAIDLQYERYYEKVKSVHNIFYLGKKGCLLLCSGLKIAYLSGITDSFHMRNVCFTEQDVDDLIKNVESEAIDILLTSLWPAEITKNVPPLELEKASAVSRNMSPLISKLAKALKPRYHFCGIVDFLYERVPYRNHIEGKEMPVNATRFYSLPFVAETTKKFVLAFNLIPACKMDSKKLNEVSGPTTECPYSARDKQYFFDTVHSASSSSTTRTRRHANDGPRPSKKQVLDVGNCWFCLANKNAGRHLIIDIGNLSYLALCKGGLVPEHILIIPISHISSSTKLPDDVHKEMTQFKLTLVDYFEDRNMDVVMFERNYKSPHMCYQVVPIPKGNKDAFVSEVQRFASLYSVPFFELPEDDFLNKNVTPGELYFYIEIYVNEMREGRFVYRINDDKCLPLHFGRIFLASKKLLDMKERIDWKVCEDTESEEKFVQKLKKKLLAFKK